MRQNFEILSIRYQMCARDVLYLGFTHFHLKSFSEFSIGLTQFSMRYDVLRAAGEVANLASEGVCVSPIQ